MMYKTNILAVLLLLTIAVTVFSMCKKVDGKATPPGFDPKVIVVSSEKQEIKLTARNDVNWIFGNLTIDKKYMHVHSWDDEPLLKYKTHYKRDEVNPYFHLLGVYVLEYGEWLTLEKVDNKTLTIKLAKNETGTSRKVVFLATVGNASDNIEIEQH